MLGVSTLSLWKVYLVETGKVIKAGFADEDEARDWLESRHGLNATKYLVEEMDPDEEEEFAKTDSSDEEDDESDDSKADDVDDEDEEEDDVVAADEVGDGFAFEDDDYLDPDDGILGEVGDDDDGGKDDY